MDATNTLRRLSEIERYRNRRRTNGTPKAGGGVALPVEKNDPRDVRLEEFVMGLKWIRGHLGHYYRRNGWYKKGMSGFLSVDAGWCFDENDKLVNVLVVKKPELPQRNARAE